MDDQLVRLSKQLSYVLRHNPSSIGLTLDSSGWANLGELISLLRESGTDVLEDDIRRLLTSDGKQRLELSGNRLRAAQGDSINIDLDLKPKLPPAVLYHGTVDRFLDSIQHQGLVSGQRRHVHLSADRDTARIVGQRRGDPVVMVIDAVRMAADSHIFFEAANGVWLTDHVPAAFLRAEEREDS